MKPIDVQPSSPQSLAASASRSHAPGKTAAPHDASHRNTAESDAAGSTADASTPADQASSPPAYGVALVGVPDMRDGGKNASSSVSPEDQRRLARRRDARGIRHVHKEVSPAGDIRHETTTGPVCGPESEQEIDDDECARDVLVAEQKARHLAAASPDTEDDGSSSEADGQSFSTSAASRHVSDSSADANGTNDTADNAASSHKPAHHTKHGRSGRGRYAVGRIASRPDDDSDVDDGTDDLGSTDDGMETNVDPNVLQAGVAPQTHAKNKGQRTRKISRQDPGTYEFSDDDSFIGGVGADYTDRVDRAYYLMMVAGSAPPLLRPPTMSRQSTLSALRPQSRAECERRCGSDGFCDPSNVLGCGGVHCGRQPLDV